MEKKQYKKAMEIADTIDWSTGEKRIHAQHQSARFTNCDGEYPEEQGYAVYGLSTGRREAVKIIYRLGLLALKLNDVEEASDCYEEFVKAAHRVIRISIS